MERIDTDALDEARLEWEFEKLEREHAKCCAGAILFREQGSDAKPWWLNVVCPVDGPGYRPFRRD